MKLTSTFWLALNFLKDEKTFSRSALVFSFFFALTPFLSSVTLLFFTLLSLFHIKRIRLTKERAISLLSICFFFVLYLIGYVNSPNKERALELITRSIPTFIIPIIIIYSDLPSKLNLVSLKKAFVAGIIVSCGISIIAAFYNFLSTGEIDNFFYYELGYFIHLHPTYYSLFVLTAIIFLLQIKEGVFKQHKTYFLSFFILFIFLLQTKMAIILLLILFTVLIALRISKGNIKELLLPFIVLLLIGFEFQNNRFSELFIPRNSIEIGNFKEEGISQRLWLWDNAFKQIKEQPFFGFGFGSKEDIFRWKVEKDLLENAYPVSYIIAAKKIAKLNFHNQYVQIFYEFGLIGFSLLMGSISILIYLALRSKKYLFLVVYGIFLTFLLTENILDRQMGIYFYAFVIPLLFFEKSSSLENKKNSKKKHWELLI